MPNYVWSVVYWPVSGNLADYLLHLGSYCINYVVIPVFKLICQTCQAVLLFQSVCNQASPHTSPVLNDLLCSFVNIVRTKKFFSH